MIVESEPEEDELLSPREIRRRAESKEAKHRSQELEARDAAAVRSAVTVVLRDKGTQMGCELWRAGGVIVRHVHCSKPCLLTTSAAIPDAYHAGHATVYFSPHMDGSSAITEVVTVKLAHEEFMVVCNGQLDPVTAEFPIDERIAAKAANYCIIALVSQCDEIPAYCLLSPVENVCNKIFTRRFSSLFWLSIA